MPHAMTEDYPLDDAPRPDSAASASSNCACDAPMESSAGATKRAGAAPAKRGADPTTCRATPKRG